MTVSAPDAAAGIARAGVARAARPDLAVTVESDRELADAISGGRISRLRFSARGQVPIEIRIAAAATGVCLCDAPVVPEARVELLWYVHEQSVSNDYHRYGNLGPRADEVRAGP